MAFAYSNTSIQSNSGGYLYVAARATEVGTADLIPVNVHCTSGVLKRWRVTKLAGTSTAFTPIIYWRNSATAQFEVVRWTDTAGVNLASEEDQAFQAPDRHLYVLPGPDANADHTVLVQLAIGGRS